jgi:hypothetical protein
MHYSTELNHYRLQLQGITRRFQWISLLRLSVMLLVMALGWAFLKYHAPGYAWLAAALLLVFFILVKLHARTGAQKRLLEQLVLLNVQEIAAEKGDHSAFYDGARYQQPEHPYSFDLDIFGPNSLFQYLNRTANLLGAERLAAAFLTPPSPDTLSQRHEALQELAPMLRWRQHFLAEGRLHADPDGAYRNLLSWAQSAARPFPWWQKTGLLALNGATLLLLLGVLLNASAWMPAFRWVLVLNLLFTGACIRRIKAELAQLNTMYRIVAQYATLIRMIETAPFQSALLQSLQRQLKNGLNPASQAIIRLSERIHHLESVQNLFGALLFNSLAAYHVHILMALERWKKENARQVAQWIDAVGEMEALCSLAHLAYRAPDFVFPTLSPEVRLSMKGLGHPLITADKRVSNTLEFGQSGFVILTGSNMSGKSTFLRTVGINLVLARAGAPVCAKQFEFFPFDIYVCMKLSDSLHDNESYFYAELKRLRRIIDALENGPPAFVLLDEVLRGTNSNDKLSGTLGLVESMIRLRATGIIATHDLKVCELTAQYPDYLRNMCFEVEMTNDNLVFDYRLRQGGCVNKSASFLMKKMKVIQ